MKYKNNSIPNDSLDHIELDAQEDPEGLVNTPHIYKIRSAKSPYRINRRHFLRCTLVAGASLAGLAGIIGSNTTSNGDAVISLYEKECSESFEPTHNGEIKTIVYNRTGDRIATGGADSVAKVWDAVDGTLLTTFSRHTAPVNSVAFSPDGATIASGSSDETVEIWGASDGKTVETYIGHTGGINAVAFSPNEETVASCSDDGTVHIWNVTNTASPLIYSGHSGKVLTLAFSPDGARIVSGDDSVTQGLHLWDAKTGERLIVFETGQEIVNSVVFSPDGMYVASGHSNGDILIWDGVTGDPIQSITGESENVYSLSFNGVGSKLVSAGINNGTHEVTVWEVASGIRLMTYSLHTQTVRAVACNPVSEQVTSGGTGKIAHVWDVSQGDLQFLLSPQDDGIADDMIEIALDCQQSGEGGLCPGNLTCNCNIQCSCDSVCSCDTVCACDSQG